MDDSGLDAFQHPAGGRPADQPSADDPCSWLQIEPGWRVLSSDEAEVGTVAQIAGSRNDDIFDGLAVAFETPPKIRYVPGEQVGAIYPGEVNLTIATADTGTLEPFHAPPPETTWRPGKPPLSTRLSNWLRGKR